MPKYRFFQNTKIVKLQDLNNVQNPQVLYQSFSTTYKIIFPTQLDTPYCLSTQFQNQ